MTHRFVVTLRQFIQMPYRAGLEPLDRLFTVNARSKLAAARAVRDAGYNGKIIAVEWAYPLPPEVTQWE